MCGSKEMFLRMRAADYDGLPPHIRELFTYVEVREENEWETHKEDPIYRALVMKKKAASANIQQYLFDKRHGRSNS